MKGCQDGAISSSWETYIVIHKSAPLNEQCGIVRELSLVDISAVGRMGAVVDIPRIADISEILDESEGPVGQVGVGGVV